MGWERQLSETNVSDTSGGVAHRQCRWPLNLAFPTVITNRAVSEYTLHHTHAIGVKITCMPSRMQRLMNDLNARGIVAVAPSKSHDDNCRTRKWSSRPNCVGTHTASKSRQRRCYCGSARANVRQLDSTLPLLRNRHRSNEPDSATSCRSKLCTRPSSPKSEAACSLSHN